MDMVSVDNEDVTMETMRSSAAPCEEWIEDDHHNMPTASSIPSKTASIGHENNHRCKDDPNENDTSNCHNDNSDPMMEIVRDHVRKHPMMIYSSIAVAVCIIVDSIISFIQYNGQRNNDDVYYYETQTVDYSMPIYNSAEGGVCALSEMMESSTTSQPLWESLLVFQIGLYQNIIHASLLGGSILLVVFMGHVIWLYFVRNFVFFTAPTAILILFSDLYTIISNPNSYTLSHNQGYIIVRLVLVFCFAISSIIAYYYYECACYDLRSFITKSSSPVTTLPDVVSEPDDEVENKTTKQCTSSSTSQRPSSTAAVFVLTPNEIQKSYYIHYGAVATQICALVFLLATTIAWVRLQLQCTDDLYNHHSSSMTDNNMNMDMSSSMNSSMPMNMTNDDSNNHHHHRRLEGIQEIMSPTDEPHSPMTGDLHAFRMSYTMFAHQSFLLAMIQVGAIYPHNLTSLTVCFVSAYWRLMIACCNMLYLTFSENRGGNDTRFLFSILFTSFEVVAMIPILYACLSLHFEKTLRRDRHLTTTLHGRILRPRAATVYSQIDSSKNTQPTVDNKSDGILRMTTKSNNTSSTADDESDHDDDVRCSSQVVKTFSCATLRSIAMSDKYDRKQRSGAWFLYVGSICLCIEMIVESMILLRQNFVGTHMSYDIYKWALHSAAIYTATSFMFVETPWIYRYSRRVLMIACPVGSVIGLWQVSSLIKNYDTFSNDIWTNVIAILFVCRSGCGIIQTIGVVSLQHTEQRRDIANSSTVHETPPTNDVDAIELELAMQRARFVLYIIYFPCTLVYVIFVTILGNCADPMISPMIPANGDDDVCMVASMDLMLAQNWPGMGLFFHFGIIVPIFAIIGFQPSVPMYKPALGIATYFAGSLTCMIGIHLLCWDIVQTSGWGSLSTTDVVQRVLLGLWMLISGYLTRCLARLWNLRFIPV